MKETLEEKIARVVAEQVELAPFNPEWKEWFVAEAEHLRAVLPRDLILRIEHFGSTSVEGMVAKPIVDMVIEISDVERGKVVIPEALEPEGYDCFWRPQGDEDVPPYFTWCIKRNAAGERTHHLHFVAAGDKEAELQFRDCLRTNPKIASEYGELKKQLVKQHGADRVTYTQAKGEFIRSVVAMCNKKSPA